MSDELIIFRYTFQRQDLNIVVQDGLELSILLPQSLEYQDYRPAPPCPSLASYIFLTDPCISLAAGRLKRQKTFLYCPEAKLIKGASTTANLCEVLPGAQGGGHSERGEGQEQTSRKADQDHQGKKDSADIVSEFNNDPHGRCLPSGAQKSQQVHTYRNQALWKYSYHYALINCWQLCFQEQS